MKIKCRGRFSHRRKHRIWQVQEAKAKFSELIKETVSSGYQTIKNGELVAYLVSKEEFELYWKPRKSLLEVFDHRLYLEVDLDIQRNQGPIGEVDFWSAGQRSFRIFDQAYAGDERFLPFG